MRIAMVVGGFPLISETFILSQITGLLDLGHEVDIFARRPGNASVAHAEVAGYNLLSRTHVFDLPTGRPSRLRRAAGTFVRTLPRHPRRMFQCLALHRRTSLYAKLNNVMHARPFLGRRYDVVMCHFGTNGIDFVFLKDLFPQLPFVIMFHKGDILLGDEKGADVYARLRERGDVFLAISECWNRKKLVEYGFDDRRIVSHRIGVDLSRFEFVPRNGCDREGRKPEVDLLTVARLHPDKGLAFGIRAVAKVAEQNPGLRIRYRIIGDGEERARLADLIVALEQRERIELLGALPATEVAKWMRSSHLFLLPSLAEGTPTVLLEAQASGMPVVATAVGGVPDILPECASGCLVPPGDVPALAGALQALLEHPERWPAIGVSGRRFVETHHDAATLNRALACLFASLLPATAGSPGVRSYNPTRFIRARFASVRARARPAT